MQNNSSDLFDRQYKEAMIAIIKENKCTCLQKLVEYLGNRFLADESGLIRVDNEDLKVLFLLPEHNSNILNKLFTEEDIKNDLQRNELSIERFYFKSSFENIRSLYFYNLLAFKVPILFNEDLGKGTLYVCLNDPKFIVYPLKKDYYSIQLLSNLIDVWAWRINHHRSLFETACSKLEYAGLNAINKESESNIEELNYTIHESSHCFGRMMNIAEILKLKRNDELVNKVLKDWHHCTPPFWPPCKGKELIQDRKILIEILIRWFHKNNDQNDRNQYRTDIENLRSCIVKSMCLTGDKEGITLSKKTLFHFYLSEAIKENVFDSYTWFSIVSTKEELELTKTYLSELIQYVMTDSSIDLQVINGIIWLVSDYVHFFLNLPVRIDIKAHLLQASRGEPVLHSLRNYYRAHFFHAIEVCFLGHFLMELEIRKGNKLWQIIARKLHRPNDYKYVFNLWYLASLLHDIGYGIDALKGVKDLLQFFKNAAPLKELGDELKDAVDSISQKIENINFINYTKEDKPGEDHGIIAALHIQGLLEAIQKDDDSINVNLYQPAIRAIGMHNSRKHIINFDKEPIAFLLVICDTLQEWNRLQMNFSTAPAQILSKLNGYNLKEEAITGPLKHVHINARYDDKRKQFCLVKNSRKSEIHFKMEFNDEINKNSGVFNLWIDASCNFQRLDFSDLDFEIKVEYITPLYINNGRKEWQFHRLRDAARDTHMGFLQNWFPKEESKEYPGSLNKGVEFIQNGLLDDPGSKEILIYHLRYLSEYKITKGIETFREHLAKWNRFNEDRVFAGDYAVQIPE